MGDKVSKQGFRQTVRFSSSGYHSTNNLCCPVNHSQSGGTELTFTHTYSQVRTWAQACFQARVCLKVDVFTNLSTQPHIQPGPWSPVARQRGGISKTCWSRRMSPAPLIITSSSIILYTDCVYHNELVDGDSRRH